MADRILVGTRKGVFDVRKAGGAWKAGEPMLKGEPIAYAVRDARTKSVWASIDHGHWGCKLARSKDDGATYAEADPPKYPEDAGASAKYYWVLQPGHASEPKTFYVGTQPGGLFRTDDDGFTWSLVRPLWDLCQKHKWTGGGRDEAGIHTILVDPKNPKHVKVAVSCAGVLETKDGGASWAYVNKGLPSLADEASPAEYVYDPHVLSACAAAPDVIWQANHVGVFRTTDGAGTWIDLSKKPLVHFGFVIAAHPKDAKRAWIVPMDSDQKRMTIDGALVVMRTDDGGGSWKELRNGLPQQDAWDFPYRHALDVSADGNTLAFGTTSGNLYVSEDGGGRWQHLFHSLPLVYSVRFA
jgi:photosystem II stability/assembly factor-like uncharacterized protein